MKRWFMFDVVVLAGVCCLIGSEFERGQWGLIAINGVTASLMALVLYLKLSGQVRG
jgi:hypothetical protein